MYKFQIPEKKPRRIVLEIPLKIFLQNPLLILIIFTQVRAVYIAASHLKIDRVARKCAQHLIKYLSTENCIEIRSLPGIAKNKDFIKQVDEYIGLNVRISSKFKKIINHPLFYFYSSIKFEKIPIS